MFGVTRESAAQLIAMGLTYCSISAPGSSTMSRAMSISTGAVRRPRMMPPMPSVSAIVWRRPRCLGTSKSVTVPGL